jgi:hypothetical protein
MKNMSLQSPDQIQTLSNMGKVFGLSIFHTLFSTASFFYPAPLLMAGLFRDDSKKHPGGACEKYE